MLFADRHDFDEIAHVSEGFPHEFDEREDFHVENYA